MSDLESSFSKLLGRAPNDEERQNLLRVKEALGIKNNDALWLILMALEHYDTRYNKLPREIEESILRVLDSSKEVANASMEASAHAVQEQLAEAVNQAAQQVAINVSGRRTIQWITACLVITTVVVGLLSWGMFESGRRGGLGEGYARMRDAKAAASWANTPQGRAAFRLAQVGSIDALANCSYPGWQVRDGICHPGQTKDGIYGWRIAPTDD